MNATTVSWTLVLFFGSAIAFSAIRRLTEGQGALVTLAAQVAALGLIVAAIILVVRRLSRDGDSGES